MQRILLTLVAAVVTAIGLFWPAIDFNTGSDSASLDPVVVTDYSSEYTLARDGGLTATETLTTEFPAGRHGIFRFWDQADGDTNKSGVRYRPEGIRVTMDGQSVPVQFHSEGAGRFEVAQIGDPDRTVTPGSHKYQISYRVSGTIADGDPGKFIWRVVANGWKMQILQSTNTIHFPEAPTSFDCTTNDGTPCTITEPDATTRVVTTGVLKPATGVAVKADMPFAGPGRDELPWPINLDRVLGTSVKTPIIFGLLSLIPLALGFFWVRRSNESAPLMPVMFEPPANPIDTSKRLGPAECYFVNYESVPKKALTATLFHLAEQGHVRLDRTVTDSWTVTSQLTPARYATLSGVDTALINSLGLATGGSTFSADGSKSAGLKLSTATREIEAATRGWGSSSGSVQRSGFESLGKALVALALALAAILFIMQILPASIMALPIAAFVIGGAGLYVAGVGTRRTRLGREVWSRSGGFERLLSTTSNQERLDFSARKDLFTSYIPYAMAFNCADAWAAKYQYATGQPPPDPVWFPGFYVATPHGFMGTSTGLDSFESSLSSSISAYTASQASSSSGGGGFGGGFSGGGGGGGGGGSW
ncbi:MAG: DUF2207 domain-containing protein [Gordonia sp. (in: high G+C Gram-positive bacteria)]|uniref:DUF2207 family protein n=1 Tax=Gordonia sp. (in: high G+C Gram-positive bacteria) TaxID=84139 RepID=UPI003C78F176